MLRKIENEKTKRARHRQDDCRRSEAVTGRERRMLRLLTAEGAVAIITGAILCGGAATAHGHGAVLGTHVALALAGVAAVYGCCLIGAAIYIGGRLS